MLSPQQNYVMFLLVTLTLQYVHTTSISLIEFTTPIKHVLAFFNSTICIIWRRALSICTTFFLISIFAPWRNPSIVLLYKSIHFLKG